MVKEQIQYILTDLITTNPGQPRKEFDEESEFEMAQSVKNQGILQPLRLREIKKGELYVVVTGERRLRGARRAGLKEVPGIIESSTIDQESLFERAVIENVVRKDLAPMELADAIHQIMVHRGWSGAEVSAKLNISAAAVSRSQSMRKLSVAVQQQVRDGIISPAKAYEISKVDDVEFQKELVGLAVAGATRDQLVGAIKRTANKSATAEGVTKVTAKLTANREVSVKGIINGIESLIEAAEEFLSKARKARTSGMSVGTFVVMMRDQANA